MHMACKLFDIPLYFIFSLFSNVLFLIRHVFAYQYIVIAQPPCCRSCFTGFFIFFQQNTKKLAATPQCLLKLFANAGTWLMNFRFACKEKVVFAWNTLAADAPKNFPLPDLLSSLLFLRTTMPNSATGKKSCLVPKIGLWTSTRLRVKARKVCRDIFVPLVLGFKYFAALVL